MEIKIDKSDCALVNREGLMVSYLAGTISVEDAEVFEAHYFACDRCWRELQQGLEIRAALKLQSDTPTLAVPLVAAPARHRSAWRWVPLAAAATLVLAAVLTMWFRGASTPAPKVTLATAPTPAPQTAPAPAPTTGPTPPPSPSRGRTAPAAPQPVVALSVLARVEPPPYVPLALRGPHDDAAERFDAAMQQHYVGGDYAGAIPGLRAAVGLDSKSARATVFLAICQLLSGELDPAIEGLQHAIALGESPYLEDAHFYLAKARLRQGRLQDAREELTQTIARHGRLEKEARQLQAQVDALIGARGR